MPGSYLLTTNNSKAMEIKHLREWLSNTILVDFLTADERTWVLTTTRTDLFNPVMVRWFYHSHSMANSKKNGKCVLEVIYDEQQGQRLYAF